MNITPQTPTLSIPTAVNPQTDSLRRENNIREVITKPTASSQSPAEKGVASDKERGRTPAQNNENVDFESIRKQAESATKTINGDSNRESGSSDQQSTTDGFYANEDAIEDDSENGQSSTGSPDGTAASSREAFTEQRIINELQLRDQEVRAHELAHASVGGASTGSPSYTFETGPDGKKYAVGGEVSVDLSTVNGDPRATISKMQKVYAAALAPADPSIQDTRVAASASKAILQAQTELVAISLADSSEAKNTTIQGKSSDVFSAEENQETEDFDTLVNRTLASQDEIVPNRDSAVDERALRIESLYSGITTAYEKEPSFHFQLTA
ncbi:putative metalloprotease CJM1_0395 family protein [Colwellia hornerae]|uniref:Catalase n=1 Tax=Colwellia hornerae TaxID=89402 RepID=A0A5C6QKF4_9GAMM|nr:putative metalloprotease CJM1_0395 family protein [Colwellia hornerae]TWX58586.1 hypothetical protein ESZ28_02140 [Colwellia hornerae]TWX59652.1 hypothetical protein ESZ26_09455 [Colwellia hornerae]TWX69379.1 hypothetical protein ESZ27_05455 [Colwellia hornerae]